MPPANRSALLLSPRPPPPVREEYEDPQKEERAIVTIEMLSTGQVEKTVVRHLVRAYAIPPAQARAEYAEAVAQLQKHLDDEGAINAVHAGALARIQILQRRFLEIALEPIFPRVREVPGSDPDNPDGAGAIWRMLTPGEHASAVGARAQAAKVSLQANEVLVKITHPGVCHTDAFTRSGDDPDGLFPAVQSGRIL